MISNENFIISGKAKEKNFFDILKIKEKKVIAKNSTLNINNIENKELTKDIINEIKKYIFHVKKVKINYEINSLLRWDDQYFICTIFKDKTFLGVRIYTFQNDELYNEFDIKIKYCSNKKDALFKINDNYFGVS